MTAAPLLLAAAIVALSGAARAQAPADSQAQTGTETQAETPRGNRYGLAPLAGPAATAPAPHGSLPAGLAVAQGTERIAALACHSCHGLEGNADGSGAFPRLAGQHAWYLFKQLQDYASGRRPNEVMTPIARLLTERQMQDVAAWYASRPPGPPDAAPDAEVGQRQLGGALSAVGVPERGVTACTLCHGRLGEGVPPSVPALAGQYAPYTALQLRLWQRGTRRNDPLGVMAAIARGMTDAEIEAAAAYFAVLEPQVAQEARPPAPAAR